MVTASHNPKQDNGYKVCSTVCAHVAGRGCIGAGREGGGMCACVRACVRACAVCVHVAGRGCIGAGREGGGACVCVRACVCSVCTCVQFLELTIPCSPVDIFSLAFCMFYSYILYLLYLSCHCFDQLSLLHTPTCIDVSHCTLYYELENLCVFMFREC